MYKTLRIKPLLSLRPDLPSENVKYRLKIKYFKRSKINVKKIAFGNKDTLRVRKMGASVLLRLYISSNEICSTAYALLRIHEQNYTTMEPMIPKEIKYNLHYSDVRGDVLLPPHGTNTSCSVVK